MSYLTIRNLHQSFGDKTLFHNLDMTIVPGQRVALIARNGTGKTSLLNIIMGSMLYPEGTVELNRNIRTSILAQEQTLDPAITVQQTLINDTILSHMHELGIWDYDIQVQLVLTELGLGKMSNQQVGLLSGGELKRLALAQVLLSQPDFLILDEPTNHLDIQMIERLEEYLTTGNKTVLLITHDRYFLEHVCTHIYELDHGQIRTYSGNYSYYIQNKAERESIEQSTLHKMKQLYKQELEWIRRAPQGRQTKSNYRSGQFGIIADTLQDQKKRVEHITTQLDIGGSYRDRLGGLVLKVKNLTKTFGDKSIVDKRNYEFHAGERIGIIGPNGVGKSSLIKLLLGEIEADSGSTTRGETVTTGYYSQTIPARNPAQTVLGLVQEMGNQIRRGNTTMSASLLLEQRLFSPKQQRALIGSLSGGEKRRLALLMTLIQQPNFLILDEPTNDFDIMTINILEQWLMNFSGCLIIISHDRYFMDKLVDHLFVMEGDGEIMDFWGSYTDYHQSKAKGGRLKAKQQSSNPSQEATQSPAKGGKNHYTMNEYLKQITKLTAQKDKLLLALDEGGLDYADYTRIGSQINDLSTKITELEEKWFELAE